MVTTKRRRENAVFRAIADPTRREILRLLRNDRLTVGEIAANFRTSRPAISKHLRLLRSAGLVVSHKDGAASICGLNAKPLRTVNTWLQDYREFWGESLRNLKRYIEQPENQEDKPA
jgi:DNA-binding transcriptional ArsR family regulator